MNTVTSDKNPLAYLKAIATLLGSTATALLAIYSGNEVLTVIAVIATVFTTWVVPNAEVAPESNEEVDWEHEQSITYPEGYPERSIAQRRAQVSGNGGHTSGTEPVVDDDLTW